MARKKESDWFEVGSVMVARLDHVYQGVTPGTLWWSMGQIVPDSKSSIQSGDPVVSPVTTMFPDPV
jgi:hypothetical protein